MGDSREVQGNERLAWLLHLGSFGWLLPLGREVFLIGFLFFKS